MVKTNIRTGVALLTVFAACAAASANLVDNGSFENGSGPSIDNWFLTTPAVAGNVADYPGGGSSIYGDRFLVLNRGTAPPIGSATNDFGTTALGVEYRVDFVYGQFGGASGEQMLTAQISYGSAITPLETELFMNITPSTSFSTLWRQGSFTFVGVGLPTSITFSDEGSLGFMTSDLLVDNVSIVALAVPEPATVAALGLGVIALLKRRRRA